MESIIKSNVRMLESQLKIMTIKIEDAAFKNFEIDNFAEIAIEIKDLYIFIKHSIDNLEEDIKKWSAGL